MKFNYLAGGIAQAKFLALNPPARRLRHNGDWIKGRATDMTIPNRESRRNRWILIAAILVVAAFLLGFVPQYLNNVRTSEQLHTRDQQIVQLQQQATLSRLRDLASLLYLEATRKNYGIASQRASALFDLIQTTINTGPDAALKDGLVSALAQRDEIVSKLAKPDAGVEKDVQDLMDRLFQLTFK